MELILVHLVLILAVITVQKNINVILVLKYLTI
jgi:hypothetical protein